MNHQKSPLTEISQSLSALKSSRVDPIQQSNTRESTGFIRSLALNTSVPALSSAVRESINVERMLEAQLDAEVKKLEKSVDTTDYVSFDIPLLIRLLEHAREGIKSDVELHDLVERLIAMRNKGVLTMDDYYNISGGDIEGTEKEYSARPIAAELQGESVDMLKKLAGIK